MEQDFYLLTTLLEQQDCISDGHALYANMEDAQKAFAQEVADCQENFNPERGEFVLDLPRVKEWRTEDGCGYTVTLETIKPL